MKKLIFILALVITPMISLTAVATASSTASSSSTSLISQSVAISSASSDIETSAETEARSAASSSASSSSASTSTAGTIANARTSSDNTQNETETSTENYQNTPEINIGKTENLKQPSAVTELSPIATPTTVSADFFQGEIVQIKDNTAQIKDQNGRILKLFIVNLILLSIILALTALILFRRPKQNISRIP